MEIKAVNILEISQYCFENVFRVTTDHPGFVYLDLGAKINSYELRSLMVQLKKELSKIAVHKFKKPLTYDWLGRFDQQVSTKYHLDNAGDQSFLMLGYEPSEIDSELYIADYVKFSYDHKISPSDYFEKYNPVFNDHEAALKPYVVKVSPFRKDTYKIVLINNSNSNSECETLGVLHMARIIRSNLNQSRIINSMMLSMNKESDIKEIGISDEDFKHTDFINK